MHKSAAGLARRRRRRRLGRHHHAQAARLRKTSSPSSASAGGVYAELPDETDPQFNALVNWKNDDGTLGVHAAGVLRGAPPAPRRPGDARLRDDRARQRASRPSNPDLSGVCIPTLIGSALFEQERERTGGLIDIQLQADRRLDARPQYFMSDLDATNYNRNYMFWSSTSSRAADPGAAPRRRRDPGYVVREQHAGRRRTGRRIAGTPSTASTTRSRARRRRRPRTTAASTRATRSATRFTLTGQIGTSEGHGETPTQDVSETVLPAARARLPLNGIDSAPDFDVGVRRYVNPVPGRHAGRLRLDLRRPGRGRRGRGGLGPDRRRLRARQRRLDRASSSARATASTSATRSRSSARARLFAGRLRSTAGATCRLDTVQNYPSDFSTPRRQLPDAISGTGRPAQLAAYNSPVNVNRDPVDALVLAGPVRGRGEELGRYAQANFEGSNWSGNIGVRFVRTEEDIVTSSRRRALAPDRSGRDHHLGLRPVQAGTRR